MYIVCALEFEAKALRRTARERGWQLDSIGPGARRMEQWAAFAVLPPGSLVVLAGVAGGLTDAHRDGAVRVGSVVAPDGREWRAEVPGSWADPTVRCLAADEVLATPAAKRAAAAATGAAIVDLESAAFARIASARGWRWAIVRGISDAVDDRLPDGVAGWTDHSGRTRVGEVAASLLARPWVLPQVIALGRRSAAAMRAVDAALRRIDADERGLGRSAPMDAAP
jgi:hypothetical protein